MADLEFNCIEIFLVENKIQERMIGIDTFSGILVDKSRI